MTILTLKVYDVCLQCFLRMFANYHEVEEGDPKFPENIRVFVLSIKRRAPESSLN